MTVSDPQELHVIEEPEIARILLPSAEARINPRSPRWKTRTTALFGLVFIAFLSWLMISPLVLALHQAGLRVLNERQLIPLLGLMFLGLTALIVVSFFLLIWIIVLRSLFSVHTTIEVNRRVIASRVRAGPFRSFRAMRANRARRIIIHPPRRGPHDWFQKPWEKRASDLLVEADEPKYKRCRVLENVPHALASKVAAEAARQLTRLAAPTSPIELVDAMDPAFLAKDDFVPPAHLPVVIESQPGELKISPQQRPVLRRLLMRRTFHVGSLLVLIATGTILTIPSLKFARSPGSDILRDAMAIGAIGIFSLAASISTLLAYFSYDATSNDLKTESRSFLKRRIRQWRRQSIAALGVEHRRGAQDRIHTVLEVRKTDGRTDVVAYGEVMALRYVASLLRAALDVPAITPEPSTATPSS